MKKFNVKDRVIFVKTGDDKLDGKIGIVVGHYANGHCIVMFEELPQYSLYTQAIVISPACLEHVEPEVTKFKSGDAVKIKSTYTNFDGEETMVIASYPDGYCLVLAPSGMHISILGFVIDSSYLEKIDKDFAVHWYWQKVLNNMMFGPLGAV